MAPSQIPLMGSEFGLLTGSQSHCDATVADPASFRWGDGAAAAGGEWVSSLRVGGPAACRDCPLVCRPGGPGSHSTALNWVVFLLLSVSPLPRGVRLFSTPLRFPSITSTLGKEILKVRGVV